MTVSIAGVLSRADGHGAQRDEWGRLVDVHAIELDDLEVAERVPLSVDHDEVVGSVTYCERASTGDVHVVAVAEDDVLAELGEMYFSAEWVCRSADVGPVWRGHSPTLVGVALVSEPGAFGLSPVTVMAGDYRRDADRMRWPVTWEWERPLMGRAVECRRGPGRPVGLVDLAPRRRSSVPVARAGSSSVPRGRRTGSGLPAGLELEYSAPVAVPAASVTGRRAWR